MVNGVRNPFRGVGSALLEGLLPRLAEQRERERRVDALNPLRQAVLEQTMGPANVFAGGPPGELEALVQQFAAPAGQESGLPAVAPPPQGQATPVQPPQPVGLQQLPADLRPSPELDSIFQEAAAAHGIPVNTLRALAAQESSFRPGAVGPSIDLPGQVGDQARGLFQFTPAEVRSLRAGDRPDFDPNDPRQAADETARRLRQRLDQGKPLDIALMEHFSGPNPDLQGPRSQQFRQQVTSKFQRLEAAQSSTSEGAQQPQPGATVQQPSAPQVREGPFGTALTSQAPQLNPAQRLLSTVAQDPAAFAEQFGSEGGFQNLLSTLQGGQAEEFTLSPGQVRFRGGRPIAGVPEPGKRTRVISGDTESGRALGIPAGERARVEETINDAGLVVDRNVLGRFGAGQDVNIQVGEGEGAFEKERGKTLATTVSERSAAASPAQALLGTIGRAQQLLQQGTQTGLGQRVILPIRQFAADFGVNIDEVARTVGVDIAQDNLASQEEFNRLMTQTLINGFEKFKGNLNDREVRLAQDSVPNLGTSEEANLRGLAFMAGSAELALEDAQRAAQAGTLEEARAYERFHNGRDPQELQRRFEQKLEEFTGRTVPDGEGRRTVIPQELLEAVPQGLSPGRVLLDGRLEVLDANGNVAGHIEP